MSSTSLDINLDDSCCQEIGQQNIPENDLAKDELCNLPDISELDGSVRSIIDPVIQFLSNKENIDKMGMKGCSNLAFYDNKTGKPVCKSPIPDINYTKLELTTYDVLHIINSFKVAHQKYPNLGDQVYFDVPININSNNSWFMGGMDNENTKVIDRMAYKFIYHGKTWGEMNCYAFIYGRTISMIVSLYGVMFSWCFKQIDLLLAQLKLMDNFDFIGGS